MEKTYMDIKKEAVLAMIDSIAESMKNQVDKASFDRTFTGKITEYINIRKCKVLSNGKTYTAAIYTDYEVGDIVRACIPCNNFADCFVVVNCSKNNK